MYLHYKNKRSRYRFLLQEYWMVDDLFCSCDLDLDLMTFIYQLDLYSLEIHRMCRYEVPTSRLLNVIVRQTDRQTDRQNRAKL